MKLIFFDDFKLGILNGEMVIDVSDVVQSITHIGPHNLMSGLIEQFDAYKDALQEASDHRTGVPVNKVKLRAPLPKPINIICMAVNYFGDGLRSEPTPINAFQKSPSAIIGDGDFIQLPDAPATIFEGEAELALVIGKRAFNVSAKEAMNYVFGYLNFIDGSARGLPGGNFYQSKSRETFAPIGPYLVTADEIPDPHNLQVQLWNNGVLMQDYNTGGMTNKIPRIIEWITSIHTLEPGDIVAAGTDHRGLNPFQDGDQIEIETEGLGRLQIRVRDDLKRTWARETRGERQQKELKGTTPQLTGKYADKPS
ncbi:fumarylacetoacetate hydrolase family protein [Chloroflexota bacterium]